MDEGVMFICSWEFNFYQTGITPEVLEAFFELFPDSQVTLEVYGMRKFSPKVAVYLTRQRDTLVETRNRLRKQIVEMEEEVRILSGQISFLSETIVKCDGIANGQKTEKEV